MKCELGKWSEWQPKQLEQAECNQTQTRRRIYSNTTAYQHHLEACPSLPQACPADVIETKKTCKDFYIIEGVLQARGYTKDF